MIDAGACPSAVRLCLPSAHVRLHGVQALSTFVDHLGRAGATGLERALLAIASGRLHVSALLTSASIPLTLLLLSSAQAALLHGNADSPTRWLQRATWLDPLDEQTTAVIELELSLVDGGHTTYALPTPRLPPAPVALALCSALARRSQQLEHQGRPADAIAVADLGISLADAIELPPKLPAAELLLHAGNSLRQLGSMQASTYLQHAITLCAGGDDDLQRMAARASLSLTCHWLTQDALEQARDEVPWPAPPPSLEHEAAHRAALGAIDAAHAEWTNATSHLRQAVACYEELDAREDLHLAFAHHWLGLASAALGDLDEARRSLEAAVKLRSAALGDAHPDLNASRVALGCALEAAGELDAAIALLREGVSGFAHGVGLEDPRARTAADRLVSMLMDQGSWSEVEDTLRALIDASQGSAAATLPELIKWRALLSTIEQGNLPAAPPLASPSTSEDVREMLVQFARGERTKAEAFRALVSHDHWSAPTLLSTQDGQRRHGTFSSSSLTPAGGNPRWLSGVDLFERAHERYTSLEINPGVSAAESWTLEADELRQLAHWSQAIRLERALVDLGGQVDRVEALSPAFLVQLRGFSTYVSLIDPATGGLLTVLGHNGLANAAVLFTSQAAASRFAQHTGQNTVLQQTHDGRSLFRMLLDQHVDGVLIDCLSPHATSMTRAVIQAALRATG